MIRLADFTSSKFFRFLCVGASTTVLDFVLFNFFISALGFNRITANTLSVVINIVLSFFLNKFVVFRSNQTDGRTLLKQFVEFFVITGLSVLLIQTIAIYLLGQLLAAKDVGVHALLFRLRLGEISAQTINLNLAKAGAILAGMFWNFGLYNFVIFRKGEMELEEEILED